MPPHEPEIRFFIDPHGHSVAYAQQGIGPWLVFPAWWVSHLERDWNSERFRALFSGLAKHFTVIRYDRPGTGLSDRERREYTIESEAATLGSLIDHLNITECSLFANSCAGPPALLYTHRNPDRVRQLLFVGSYLNGSTLITPDLQDAMCALVKASWGLGSKTLADIFNPDMSKDEIHRLSADQQKSASAAMAEQLLRLTFNMDASDVAAKVNVPALVIHRQNDMAISYSAGRELATRLPDARLVSLPGSTHAPWMGAVQEILDHALEFLLPEKDHSLQSDSQPQQFRFSGEVWTLSFASKTVHMKNSRGLNDLHRLIANKGKELHVNALAGNTEQPAPIEQGIEILDDRTLSSYRNRLAEIDEELADPDTDFDTDHKERLLEEQDAILQQLREGMGLRGRKRKLNDPTERNRKAISARIKSSIKKINTVHPLLGKHLELSITTGIYCCYSPQEPQTWQL